MVLQYLSSVSANREILRYAQNDIDNDIVSGVFAAYAFFCNFAEAKSNEQ